jgi:hypothetical protein
MSKRLTNAAKNAATNGGSGETAETAETGMAVADGPSRTGPPRPSSSVPVPQIPVVDDIRNHIDPNRPIAIRTARLRYVYGNKVKKHNGRLQDWYPVIITLPRDIMESAGLEVGMTLVVEGYADGRVRMFPAGERLGKDDI